MKISPYGIGGHNGKQQAGYQCWNDLSGRPCAPRHRGMTCLQVLLPFSRYGDTKDLLSLFS